MKRPLLTILLPLLGSTTAYAQLVPSNSSGITPLPDPIFFPTRVRSPLSTFNMTTSELKIGTLVGTGSGEFAGEIFNDVVLSVAEDGHFKLVSFNQPPPLPPELVCTEEEVLSAIPALSLDLTVVEATDLIGCLPKYSGFRTDLEKGKTIFVGWTGADDQINPAPGTIDVERNSVSGLSAFFSLNVRPSIRFHLLEGVVTKYSYSFPAAPSDCSGVTFGDRYENLQLGQSYEEVKFLLGCDGDLLSTAVDIEKVEAQYNWGGGNRFTSYNPFQLQFPPPASFNEGVTISFLNGQLASSEYFSNETFAVGEACTAAELIDVFEGLRQGDLEAAVLNGIPCQPASEHIRIEDGVRVVNYSWASEDYSSSVLTSVNRTINVTIQEGVVSRLGLTRS